jgi:hypothetical protein
MTDPRRLNEIIDDKSKDERRIDDTQKTDKKDAEKREVNEDGDN